MTYAPNVRRRLVILAACLLLAGVAGMRAPAAAQNSSSQAPGAANEFNDSHFHLTNYIQQGMTPREFLQIMGTRVGRSTLFGIPLQQQWSYANSGDFAPTYYLHSDAPLYYYSFTDAYIASVYKSLTPAEQARFDPMITGFNPADMYGVDHIRRVLQVFPGRVHRHRRVQHPQGVRLGEGLGRDGQPDQSGARSHPRLRRRSRASW